MTTITVDEYVWKKLNKIKYNLGLSTISEVIRRLLKISQKIENDRARKK